ncbi:unnamed protein product, partial [Prorocentrum cordatum]
QASGAGAAQPAPREDRVRQRGGLDQPGDPHGRPAGQRAPRGPASWARARARLAAWPAWGRAVRERQRHQAAGVDRTPPHRLGRAREAAADRQRPALPMEQAPRAGARPQAAG